MENIAIACRRSHLLFMFESAAFESKMMMLNMPTVVGVQIFTQRTRVDEKEFFLVFTVTICRYNCSAGFIH